MADTAVESEEFLVAIIASSFPVGVTNLCCCMGDCRSRSLVREEETSSSSDALMMEIIVLDLRLEEGDGDDTKGFSGDDDA